jgi:hypothetical protein
MPLNNYNSPPNNNNKTKIRLNSTGNTVLTTHPTHQTGVVLPVLVLRQPFFAIAKESKWSMKTGRNYHWTTKEF